jgi:hypothetical protein
VFTVTLSPVIKVTVREVGRCVAVPVKDGSGALVPGAAEAEPGNWAAKTASITPAEASAARLRADMDGIALPCWIRQRPK